MAQKTTHSMILLFYMSQVGWSQSKWTSEFLSRMRTLFLSLSMMLEQGSQTTLTVLPLGSNFLERVFGGVHMAARLQEVLLFCHLQAGNSRILTGPVWNRQNDLTPDLPSGKPSSNQACPPTKTPLGQKSWNSFWGSPQPHERFH